MVVLVISSPKEADDRGHPLQVQNACTLDKPQI